MKLLLAPLVTLVLFGSACAQSADPPAPPPPAASPLAPTSPTSASPGTTGTYDLTRPAMRVELPDVLREVSGLTVLPDGRLAAVQDEQGVLYTLDPQTGAIVEERAFRGEGDYEGVERTPGAVWVLRSNGALHELPENGGAPVEHDTPLKGKCDAEGLGYDAADERLLIACKEDPGEGLGDVRALYAFDLGTRQLAAEPAALLDRAAVDDPEAEDDNFKPSALAVHPQTGQIYVVSSVRKAVAVLDRGGRLLTVTALPADQNAQPEGIAFAPDGTLYLSNEGPDGAATLSRFDVLP